MLSSFRMAILFKASAHPTAYLWDVITDSTRIHSQWLHVRWKQYKALFRKKHKYLYEFFISHLKFYDWKVVIVDYLGQKQPNQWQFIQTQWVSEWVSVYAFENSKFFWLNSQDFYVDYYHYRYCRLRSYAPATTISFGIILDRRFFLMFYHFRSPFLFNASSF